MQADTDFSSFQCSIKLTSRSTFSNRTNQPRQAERQQLFTLEFNITTQSTYIMCNIVTYDTPAYSLLW